MRKKEAQEWINRGTENLKNCRWPGEYVEGFTEGCGNFLNWLIQQGVIKQ